MATVILGTGIIGLSTAYSLSASSSTPPSSIHLVDASSTLFSSASGFAGGFLAKDWFADELASLGELSFELHRKLALENDGGRRWGYVASRAMSLVKKVEGIGEKAERGDDWLRRGTSRADAAAGTGEKGKIGGMEWLKTEEGDVVEEISEAGTTAQVDPLLLCQFLLSECLARGVQLHHPYTATSLSTSVAGTIDAITLTPGTGTSTTPLLPQEIVIPLKTLILTTGPWTPHIFHTLFPTSPLTISITPLAGHSLLLRSPRFSGLQPKAYDTNTSTAHALFTTSPSTSGLAPELFTRRNGDIYLAGLNSSSIPLPPASALPAVPQVSQIGFLKDVAEELLGTGAAWRDNDNGLEVVRDALCFRPVTERGLPIVARVPGALLASAGGGGTNGDLRGGEQGSGRGQGGGAGGKFADGGGVYIASGHGPWGISLSLGTGQVMAELVEGREVSADISGLGLQI